MTEEHPVAMLPKGPVWTRTGVPSPVREVRLAAGAGYVYAICGSLSTMPGLPSRPAAERIDVDLDTGQIVGLR